MSCERCPCPDVCLAWPIFCEWAAEEPADPVKLRHICARSAMGAIPPRSVDDILAEAKAEGIPERTSTRTGCCDGGP